MFKVKVDYGYPTARVLFYRNEVNSKLVTNDQKHKLYDRGDGVYILLIFNVTEEDNSKYMCILVNNEERVISEAELYVVPKEQIKIPDMLLEVYDQHINTTNKNIDLFDTKLERSIVENEHLKQAVGNINERSKSVRSPFNEASISKNSSKLSVKQNKKINNDDNVFYYEPVFTESLKEVDYPFVKVNQSTLKERKIQSPYNNVRSNQKHHVNEPIFKSHIKEESDQYISSISEDSSNESTLTDYKNRFKQSNNKTNQIRKMPIKQYKRAPKSHRLITKSINEIQQKSNNNSNHDNDDDGVEYFDFDPLA